MPFAHLRQVLLLLFSAGSKVLHVAPKLAFRSYENFIRTFSSLFFQKCSSVRRLIEVPARVIGEDTDNSSHGFSQLWSSGLPTVNFPDHSRRVVMEFLGHIAVELVGFLYEECIHGVIEVSLAFQGSRRWLICGFHGLVDLFLLLKHRKGVWVDINLAWCGQLQVKVRRQLGMVQVEVWAEWQEILAM